MTTVTSLAPAMKITEPSSATSRLREQFLEARRQEILEAARSVFVAKGCDAASMQDIAKAAGVSAGNIYRYFPNKDALIVAVCDRCEADHRESFDQVAGETSSPLQALIAMGDHAFETFTHDHIRDEIMLTLESALVAARHEQFGPMVREQTALVRDRLTDLVSAAQANGELDPAIEPRVLATLLLSVVSGTQLTYLQVGGDVKTDAVWELLQRMVYALAPAAE